jgi:hypothetical protein
MERFLAAPHDYGNEAKGTFRATTNVSQFQRVNFSI